MADENVKFKTLKIKTGSTGTGITSGYLNDEHITALQGNGWAIEADKMRRSDDIICALEFAFKMPILSALWEFEAGKPGDELSEKIKKACEWQFFKGLKKTWTDLLTEYMSILTYGYYLAEPITGIIESPEFGKLWGYKNFAFRSPKTIEKWKINADDELEAVYQQATGVDNPFSGWIPFEKLLLISLNREGNMFEGRSPFRGAYGNYIRKKLFNKIQLISIERAALGFPLIKYPVDWQEGSPEFEALETAAQHITSDRSQYLMIPLGVDVTFPEIPAKISELNDVIKTENTNMTYVILADFMLIGSGTQGGSYALIKEKLPFYLASINFVAWLFIEKFTKYIDTFIKWNFAGAREEQYAKLVVSGIEKNAVKELVTSLKMAKEAGIITPDETLEKFVRTALDVPLAEKKISIYTPPVPPAPLPETDAEKIDKKEDENEKENDKNNSEPAKFADKPRVLNKYEEKVNFEKIEKDFVNQQDNYNAVIKVELQKIIDTYILELRKRTITDNGDIFNVLQTLEPTGVKELENTITGLIKKSVVSGREQVNTELKKAKFADGEKLAAGVYAWVKVNAKRLAENKMADLKKKMAGTAATEASFYPLNKPLDVREKNVVIAAARAAGIDYIDNVNNLDATSIIPLAVNVGRKDAAESNDEVIGFLYSAVMDNDTTDICRALNGQTRAIDDNVSAKFDPPNHFNCRSILIPISASDGIPEGGFTGFNYSE